MKFLRFRGSHIALLLGALCAGNIRANSAFDPCFDNEKMQDIAQRGSNDTGTLLYVWSPRMVLSLTQAHLAAQAAQAQGLDFFPLHDARLPEAELRHALQTAKSEHPAAAQALQKSEPLCASDLVNADALRHFPTTFVLTARGTHRFPIIGAMPQSAWQLSISERLKP